MNYRWWLINTLDKHWWGFAVVNVLVVASFVARVFLMIYLLSVEVRVASRRPDARAAAAQRRARAPPPSTSLDDAFVPPTDGRGAARAATQGPPAVTRAPNARARAGDASPRSSPRDACVVVARQHTEIDPSRVRRRDDSS